MPWSDSITSFIAGFVIATFADPLKNWLFRPVLTLSFEENEDCLAVTPESTDTGIEMKAIYVRFKVTNMKGVAQGCRAYLVKIEQADKDGKFQDTIYCDSIPLAWSCQQTDARFDPIELSARVNQFFDVIAVRKGQIDMVPQIKVSPYRYAGLFVMQGIFRYTVQVTASNAEPVSAKIIVEWEQDWATMKVRPG